MILNSQDQISTRKNSGMNLLKMYKKHFKHMEFNLTD